MTAEWTKESVESMAYKDLYNFHKAFGLAEHFDSYWVNLVAAAGELNAKYANTKMAGIVSRHLICVIELLDKEAKGE